MPNQRCAVCCDSGGSIAILFAAFCSADDCAGQPKSHPFMPECLTYSYPCRIYLIISWYLKLMCFKLIKQWGSHPSLNSNYEMLMRHHSYQHNKSLQWSNCESVEVEWKSQSNRKSKPSKYLCRAALVKSTDLNQKSHTIGYC